MNDRSQIGRRARQSAGTPRGGRFAPQTKAEGQVSLPDAPQKDMAYWFDDQHSNNPPGTTLEPPQPVQATARDKMIAARIRAGHVLVTARRARLSNPNDPDAGELLRRAEEAVEQTSRALERGFGGIPTNPEARR